MKTRWWGSIAFAVILVTFFSTPGVLADPPVSTPPTIDGTIGTDWVDKNNLYPTGTWLISDPANDSLWGSNNEIKNIYINWNSTYLYLGFDFNVSSNGFVAYVDFNDSAGIPNFASGAGYTGAWKRLVSFPTSNAIDFFYGVWDNQTGNVYVDNGSTNSTDITASCSVAKANQGGSNYHAEIRCPWSAIGYSYPNITLKIFAAVVGGDNYGGGDVAPSGTINTGSSYSITVSATDFKTVSIGPTTVTLTRMQARPAAWPFALGALLLVGAALVLRKQ